MNNFDKIIGYTNEKEEMIRLCEVLKNSEKYLKFGIKIPKAILLSGEPGLGKTLMAKAFIAETGRKFFHCKKNKPNGEFVNEIKLVFEKAIKEAPSIIFFDDMDKFAEDNLEFNCNKEEFVAIQTGFEDIVDKDVFVVATANDTLYLPNSLMREGRFGRHIEFKQPTFADSVEIIRYFLSNNSLSIDINAESLAHILEGNSCAMLESVINEAKINAVYANHNKITYEDIKNAVAHVMLKYSPNLELDGKSKWLVAYHEAGHAVMNIIFNKTVSCVAIGKIYNIMFEDINGICRHSKMPTNTNIKDVEACIMTTLAGKASVEIQFNEIDIGTTSDLQAAMDKISNLLENVATNGFDYIYLQDEYSRIQSQQQINKNYDKKIRIIEELYNRTKNLLLKNKNFLDELAQELFAKEILLYDEIQEIAKKYIS